MTEPVVFAENAGPAVALLGVPFDPVTMDQTVAIIRQMMHSGKPHYILTANVDFLVQCRRDDGLHRILMQADLVLCDGTPLVWFSRFLGNPLPERVAGSDLIPTILAGASKSPFRLFLLGGSATSNEVAAQKIASSYPGVVVCGHYSPPYAALEEMDHAGIISRISDAKPDILLVAFGCPKQEKWISNHFKTLGVPVVIGVGATIDFLAGRVPRAPVWMRRCGLEWTFRLGLEPRRLLGRYARDLVVFAVFVLLQLWRTRVRGLFIRAPIQPPLIQYNGDQCRVVFSGKIDRRVVEGAGVGGILRDFRCSGCELDLSKVRFVDSAGVGFLVRLTRFGDGCPPILLKPSRLVQATLRLMKLTKFFRIVS